MKSEKDAYDLTRFVKAQEGVYETALKEIRSGRKMSHWMWFIFPQIAGLGWSSVSRRYSLKCLDEAKAYLADPVLGARLKECVGALLGIDVASALQIFGWPDGMKLRSSLTLFDAACPGEELFSKALDKFYEGLPDQRTLLLLEKLADRENEL